MILSIGSDRIGSDRIGYVRIANHTTPSIRSRRDREITITDNKSCKDKAIRAAAPYLVEIRQHVVGKHLPPVRVAGQLQAHGAELAGFSHLPEY